MPSSKELPFLVSLIVDEELVSQQWSYHPLARTLRLSWELLGGIPSAYVVVRRAGSIVAILDTNWKGELAEVNIHGPAVRYGSYPSSRITPMNPAGPLFRGVFA